MKIINMVLDSDAGVTDSLKHLSVSLRNEKFIMPTKVQEAPVKMLIPLTLLIFSTTFIVIFGSIAINFIKTSF